MTDPNPGGKKAATVRDQQLLVSIASIQHDQQRYDTCGDYFVGDATGALYVQVSHLPDRREMLLVAIHELCEWALCEAKGITPDEIDKFDLNYDPGDMLPQEPGDNPDAPYYHQHQVATGIERILAAELGVDWLTYERHVSELEYNNPVEPLK